MRSASEKKHMTGLLPLKRRQFLLLGAAEILGLVPLFSGHIFGNTAEDVSSGIKELISLKPLETPLLTFSGYQDDQDYSIKNRIAQDVARNPDLTAIIQKDIGNDSQIEIQFDSLKSEMLFVPESRRKYASMYRKYCLDVIDMLFSRINMTVSINDIVTLSNEYPALPENDITAFIVHRLGKKYKAVCSFTNVQQKVSRKFKLEGAFFSDQLGAVVLEITSPEEGVFDLKRKSYTIWQNNTDNIVNILTIPVEETLHYIAGQYTDRKIKETLTQRNVGHAGELKRLSNYWMSIEEAFVGGLVHALLPELAEQFAVSLSDTDMQLSFLEKSHLPQYKYRRAGILLVKKIGYRNVLDIYRDDPSEFERLIEA